MVLDELNKIPAIAASIFLKMKEVKDPKESNCKVMAQRILHFKFGDIIPKVQEAIGHLHSFLHTSYKGIYCSLCDAHTHSFIDVDKKEITFSEGFCREIVSHSLHPLTYLHVHFKKLIDLANSFVTFCDNEGEFNPEEAVPPSAMLEIQEADKQLLFNCRKFRNDSGWMEYCGGICEKFHFTQFGEFFQPDIKKYHKTVLYLQEKLLKFSPPEQDLEEMEKEAEDEADEPEDEQGEEEDKEGEEEPPAETPEEAPAEAPAETTETERKLRQIRLKKKYARYLNEENGEAPAETPAEEGETEGAEEGEEEEEPSLVDLEKKYEKMDLVHKSMNAVIPLDKMTAVFADPGVNLHEIGKHAHITQENYLLVKGIAMAENQKVEKVETPVVEEFASKMSVLIMSFFFGLLIFKSN
jgi:hypothetical protein